jgi:hypothetical protein
VYDHQLHVLMGECAAGRLRGVEKVRHVLSPERDRTLLYWLNQG